MTHFKNDITVEIDNLRSLNSALKHNVAEKEKLLVKYAEDVLNLNRTISTLMSKLYGFKKQEGMLIKIV